MRRFLKRLLLALTAIVIILLGLSVSDAAPAKYIDEYKNKSEYLSLSKKQKDCYDAVYTTLIDTFNKDERVTYKDGVQSIGVQVSLPGIMTSFDEVREVFTAVWRDNPQFFYLDNRYSVQHHTVFGREIYTDISLLYTMDVSRRIMAKRELESISNSILAGIPDTKDDFIKELRIHDALLNICTYDEETDKSDKLSENKNLYSAYGALVEGRAVCEGYARAMKLLLDRVGIKNSLISGKSVETGVGHIWNLVTINGYDYHLDATWNDVGNYPQHVYFNCTNNQIKSTHKIDKRYSSVTCGSVKDSYYIRNGLYLATDDHKTIMDLIAFHLKNDSNSIEMSFSPQAYESAREFLKDGRLTHEYIYYTKNVLWRYTLYSYDGPHVLCLQRK